MSELRATDEVATWLAAGLALRRVPGEPEDAIAAALVACAAELSTLPPPGVIADLAALLAGGRIASDLPRGGDATLRAALHAYDDDVLARLAASPRFDDAVAAHAQLSPALRGEAVALVLGALLDRIGYTGIAVSAAALRRVLGRGLPSPLTAAVEALSGEYLRLARAARQTRILVAEREVFALDHLEVLSTFGRRLAVRQLAEAADAFMAALPRRLSPRRERGLAATALPAADTYPAGGFTAIAPGGADANLENLVTSELAYMEAGDRRDPVDLFTLRYVESELLFYARDDSELRRPRQSIIITLPPDLAHARVKDPALPWQRLTLVLGATTSLVRWLASRLGDHALAIHIVIPADLPERDLLALVLSDERERGLVTLADGGLPRDATDQVAVSIPEPTWAAWTAMVEELLRALVRAPR